MFSTGYRYFVSLRHKISGNLFDPLPQVTFSHLFLGGRSQIISFRNFCDPGSLAFGIVPSFDTLTKAKKFAFSSSHKKAPKGAVLLCLGRGSNPQALRHTILSRARIPIPPPRQARASVTDSLKVINSHSKTLLW